MSEVQEFLENNGYHTERTPLDPEAEKAGVEYTNNEEHLSKIQKIIEQEHPDHPGHIPGDSPPTNIDDPAELSVKQINGEVISPPVPNETPDSPNFISLTFGALGTTIKSGIASLLHPDAMKDGHKKGVGNTSVSDLPVKRSSDTIIEFRPAEETTPIDTPQNTEEVQNAA